MTETPESTPLPRKPELLDYFKYALIGAILHPIVGGVMSILLSTIEYLYNKEVAWFGLSMLYALAMFTPLGIVLFSTAGAIYSLVFSFIYNRTAHGKASSVSNRFLYNLLFSILMGVVGPVLVFILFQFAGPIFQ
jgi:hypothetical protein